MRFIASARSLWAAVTVATTAPLLPLGAAAQPAPDSVTAVPGPEYTAEGLKADFLGTDYRSLWTTPLRVNVLDLDRFAGGLTVVQRGGGLQTKGLRLRGADRREYAFRSVNKQPHLARDPALRGTAIGKIIQDQTSSLYPGAALAVAPLLEAAGILHVTPQLVVLPDHPALGEFREEFAGTLGYIEERPDEISDEQVGFGGFERIIGTDRLLERLEESPEDRLNARAYLAARLFDLVIGDWDRHFDQWRWGQVDRGGVRYWVPIPRDRDYAFVDYDGWFMDVGRNFMPNAVQFGPRIDNVYGLTINARALDRRLLAGLDRAAWDSVAGALRGRLTDQAIDAAGLRLPPEFQAHYRERIAPYLKTRRDDLPDAARRFYSLLSTEVDVRATDQADLARVRRLEGEAVEVALYEMNKQGEPKGQAPYFVRRFSGDETNEVRLYLHGGDDRAVITGDVPNSVMVRIMGGGGDDVLADSSVVRDEGPEAGLYDDRGENRLIRGRATALDTDRYDEPERELTVVGETARDWGASLSYAPVLDYRDTDGLIVGAGPVYTRYGFRKFPYAYKLTTLARVGLGTGEVAVDVAGDFRNAGSRGGYSFLLSGSELESLRFYGLGNQTEADQDGDFYIVRQDQLTGVATVNFGLPAGGRLGVGPVAKYTMSDLPPGTPFQREHRFGKDIGQVGALGVAEWDLRDNAVFPQHGARLQLGASAYPGVWSVPDPFGELHGVASAYLTPSWGWSPTLAVRAGGKKLWGEFPLHEAAFLGGSRTIRGYPYQRFAGDALVFGNAEVRAPLGTANLLLVRGQLGALALADAGRVYLDGESSTRWHTALGSGLWFRFTVRETPLGASVTYAWAEDQGRVYLKLGSPF